MKYVSTSVLVVGAAVLLAAVSSCGSGSAAGAGSSSAGSTTSSVSVSGAAAASTPASSPGATAGGQAVGSGATTGATPAATCEAVAAKFPSLKGTQIVIGSSPGAGNYDAPDPNDPNKIVGVEPDIYDAVSKCVGFTYRIQKQDFNGLIPALQAKHINFIAAGMYASDERAKQISFVQYMKAGEASLVPKGNPKKITSLVAACGATAAEAVGTVENAILDKQSAACKAAGKPGIAALSFQGNDQAVNAVAQGRADIFLTDSGVAGYLAAKMGKLEVGFPIVSEFVFGFGIAKSDTTLLNAVQESLTVLYRSGRLKELITKWGFAESQVYVPAIKA